MIEVIGIIALWLVVSVVLGCIAAHFRIQAERSGEMEELRVALRGFGSAFVRETGLERFLEKLNRWLTPK